MSHDQRELKVTYLRNLNFRNDFCSFQTDEKYYFNILDIVVVKTMNNPNIYSAYSYLYPHSRFNSENVV